MINKFCTLFSSKQNIFHNVIAKEILKRKFCTIPQDNSRKKNIKYLLILDFEATCDKKTKIVQEIIEFPCLKINLSQMKEEGRFHHYVRPLINPNLTSFCIELTGILQDMVNDGVTFTEVYRLFSEWREQEGLTEENSVYVTSGDWDLGHMMPKQCQLSGLEMPSHMKEWIDIKKLSANFSGQYKDSLYQLIKFYGLNFEGRQHSGIVDCLNIYNVVKKMAELGAKFEPTSRLVQTDLKTKVHVLNQNIINFSTGSC